MQLICVPPDQAARVWPHVRELILEAMRRGDLSAFRDVERSVLAREALIWLAVCSPDEPALDPDQGQAHHRRRHPGPHRPGCRAQERAHPGYAIAAAAVTEIADTEWRRVCIIVACAGAGMRAWLPLIDGIEAYARAAGCAAVRIVGRQGWARVLRRYETKRIILEKDL